MLRSVDKLFTHRLQKKWKFLHTWDPLLFQLRQMKGQLKGQMRGQMMDQLLGQALDQVMDQLLGRMSAGGKKDPKMRMME
jgi:hypothetical protein